jgi:ribosome biogenesis GTPase
LPEDPEDKHLKNIAKTLRSAGLKAARKKLRRNLNRKPPRRKDWSDAGLDESDENAYGQVQKVMPRDEGDRRRALEQAAFQPDGDRGSASPPEPPHAGRMAGTVVAVSSGSCRVLLNGHELACGIRGNLSAADSVFTNPVAVGDEVVVSEEVSGGAMVEAVLPRRTTLARPDVFRRHRQQMVVANADQLLIVSSWLEPTIWLELIDRYLIAALRSGLEPIICVNKVDLADDEAELQETMRPYDELNYRIALTSAETGEGVDELRRLLAGRTTVLAGLSGTGKSSLLSAVQPGMNLKTGAVNISRGRTEGSHTTVQATMFRLDLGGSVIDTPGIQEFGLAGLRRNELAGFYPEIDALAPGCRFSNCSHVEEPDCAVAAAQGADTLAASRYHSYKTIHATLPE